MLRRHRRIVAATAAAAAIVAGAIATAAAISAAPSTFEPDPEPDPASTVPTGLAVAELPPPEGLDELAPGLMGAVEMGVPESWSPFDLDPILLTLPDYSPEAEPLRRLATCPAGAIRDEVAPWIARRYSSIDEPLDNGLLSVETVLELESDTDFAADVTRLDECQSSESATLNRLTGTVELPLSPTPREIATTEMTITSAATDDVPYASRMTIVWVHDDRFSVTVLFSGVDVGESWGEAAALLGAKALAALVDPATP